MNSSSKKFSSFFLCHGIPLLAIQDNEYTQFLDSLGKTAKPKAIIIFTAHWEDNTTQISYINGTYEMFYDIYGFPKELYQVKYPAKGSPELAEKIKETLEKNGIKTQFDTKRGLDHGSWTLLCKLFPKADIPVVQMSVNPNMEPKKQFEIGKALRELDYDDVMVIGSGVSVHNRKKVNFRDFNCEPYDWAVKFDDWLIEKAKNKDLTALANFMAEAPHARDAVPSAEHFVPLLIAAGGIDSLKDPKALYREYQGGSLSYLCLQFA